MEEKRDYDQFRLRISANGSIEVSHFDTVNQEHPGPEERVPDDPALWENIRNDLKKLGEGTLEGEDIQHLGRNMYNAVFPGRVGDFFELILQNIKDERNIRNGQQGGNKNRWLRVIIEVHPTSPISTWPLEFLYCERMGTWLATERPSLTLSRHLTLGGTLDLRLQEPPLRTLVVISDPEELGGVISTKVLEEIGKLAKPPKEGEEKSMDVKVLGRLKNYQQDIPGIDYLDQPAKYENIVELIKEEWQPHVLHFIGHGKFEKNKGCLGFIKDDDDAHTVDWISADDISQLFTDWLPRLVLLQACQGAQSGTEPGFMSLADRISKRNIPAVVAMQFAITNDFATIFAQGFYEALRDGQDVDAAVQIGRYKITNKARWTNRDFGAPVLFTYRPDAIMHRIHTPSTRIAQPDVPDKNNTYLTTTQRVTRKIQNALKYLGEGNGEVDLDRARGWMDDVIELKDDALAKVKNKLCDARECLEMGDEQGAVKRLQEALNSPVLKVPAVETKQAKGFERAQDQPKSLADRSSLTG